MTSIFQIFVIVFFLQWHDLCSGRSRGGAWGARTPPPLFLDQTETRSAKKILEGLDDLPRYLKVWIGHCSGHC